MTSVIGKAVEKVTDVARRISGAATAIRDLREAERSIRQEHERAVRERDALLAAPPPREELVKAFDDAVDAIAQRWREDNASQLLSAVHVDAAAGAASVSFDKAPNLYGAVGYAAICALAAGPAKEALKAAVASMTYTPGPPLVERPRLLHHQSRRERCGEARRCWRRWRTASAPPVYRPGTWVPWW